jgi:hypothetical protein
MHFAYLDRQAGNVIRAHGNQPKREYHSTLHPAEFHLLRQTATRVIELNQARRWALVTFLSPLRDKRSVRDRRRTTISQAIDISGITQTPDIQDGVVAGMTS